MDKKQSQIYSWITWIYMFFIFSFTGWFWEVILYLVDRNVLINRGFLMGPWLPIYGVGSILVLYFLQDLTWYPYGIFISSMTICGVLEYMTSWILEYFTGVRWWDYGDAFMNLHGRICLISLIFFGLGGVFIIYHAAPFINHILSKRTKRKLKMLVVILVLFFGMDLLYSIKNPNTGTNITFPASGSYLTKSDPLE